MDSELRKFQDRFRYHSSQTSNHNLNHNMNQPVEEQPPPSYHEVIQQRTQERTQGDGHSLVVSTNKIKSRRHVSPDKLETTPTR